MSSMKKTAFALSALTLAVLAPTVQADLAFNVGAVSDYRFRGISQSAQDPALQGGIDWTHKDGFYLGTWASTVDFGSGFDDDLELDVYGGYKWKAANVEWDAGLIHYNYPGGDTDSTNEIYLGGNYKQFNAKAFFTNDLAGTDESGIYLTGGAGIELGQGYVLGVQVGLSKSDGFADSSFMDYRVGVSKEFKELAGVKLDLSYIGTNFDPEISTDVSNTEGTVVLSVLKAF
jgi:uncharacterized protein (TIGR02001 family)